MDCIVCVGGVGGLILFGWDVRIEVMFFCRGDFLIGRYWY